MSSAGAESRCILRTCGGATALRYALPRFGVRECRRCGMLFRDPLPNARELRAMYEDEAYHASPYFAREWDPAELDASPEVRIQRAALACLSAELEPEVPRRVLDVGCGTGAFLRLARDAGYEVEGIELSGRLAERAEREAGLRVHVGDVEGTRLEEARFGLITLWDVLEHVLDPEAVLEALARSLAPGGRIVVLTIDSGSLFNRLGALAHAATAGRVQRQLELLYDARHNYYFTRATLLALLERTGFAPTRTEPHRAHLGHWLAEPAPLWMRAAGAVVDALSVPLGLQYRQLVFAARAPEAVGSVRDAPAPATVRARP